MGGHLARELRCARGAWSTHKNVMASKDARTPSTTCYYAMGLAHHDGSPVATERTHLRPINLINKRRRVGHEDLDLPCTTCRGVQGEVAAAFRL